MNDLNTEWKFRIGDQLVSERGERGAVVGRSESASRAGTVHRSYRLQGTDQKWGDPTFAWVPEAALKADADVSQ